MKPAVLVDRGRSLISSVAALLATALVPLFVNCANPAQTGPGGGEVTGGGLWTGGTGGSGGSGNNSTPSSDDSEATNANGFSGPDEIDTADPGSVVPDDNAILVSIVMHCEEPPAYPDFENDETTFHSHRAALLDFANRLAELKVKFNYQSDWNFLKAMIAYDNGDPSTNGKNLLRFMYEDLGFEIDPHAHETRYNFADVAYLIELIDVTPSTVVGGFIVDPPADSKLEYFWQEIRGRQYVSSRWQAAALWGGGTGNHVNDDLFIASGVWHPADRDHPMEHSATAPLPNIGNFGGEWANLDLLLTLRDAGKLGAGIHTCTIMTNQRDVVDANWVAAFEAEVESRRFDTGIRWVGLSEVLQIWASQYGSQPNILTAEQAASLLGP